MIICCGEALIDMLPRESRAKESCFAPHAGGAVFNTSIALGRLGVETGFISGISTDLFGALLVETLEKSKVDTDFAIRSDRPTTLAFVRLVDGHATYTFYDEGTAGRMLEPGQMPAIPDKVQAMFFGGISLVSEPCGSAYETLMLSESARRVTMIDPNIRPSFIGDEKAYRRRVDRMVSAADIVKLSDEDLHWLRGSGSSRNLANAILETGPSMVCITEGSKGVTAYLSGFEVSVPASKVEVVDTVGAGDTFNAGLLAGLDRAGLLTKQAIAGLTEKQARAALGLGAAAAAVTVSRAGANPPWADEV